MKRIVPAVLVLALALPAHAAASKREYSGAVDAASGSIDFTLKKKRKKGKKGRRMTVRGFEFRNVPVACDDVSGTTSGRLTFGIRVRKKKFEAAADDDGGSNLNVKGTLKQKGKRTVGKLRVFGDVPLDPNGEQRGTGCNTGRLEWDAARV